jgi:hypothetical protein
MSTTGTWSVPSDLLETNLGELRDWRQSTAARIAEFRRWALVARALDEQTAARLAHLERRLIQERLTMAFVGEFSRGKTELINALFFAGLGIRLLPSGLGRTTLCPVELRWDPALRPSLRLLPIETREGTRALREYYDDAAAWHEAALDTERPEAMATALQAISETVVATAEDAASLGFPVTGTAPTEIPRWRYAIVNLPHPLLAAGLVILDTPGYNTMGTEPEVTVHRIPDAAAILFLLGADTGVTRTDRDLWSEIVEPIQGLDESCYVILNKIDGLRDGFKPESQVMHDIDRQVKATADALRVPIPRVFAVSARQGLVAKIQDDRDALIKSRLYRLEQVISRRMIEQRRNDHATAVRAETRTAFAEARALIDSRLGFAQDQLAALNALQNRNQKLVETLARKAHSERQRLEQARAVLMGMRTVHNRHLDALTRVLDPNVAREAALLARQGVLHSAFSSGIGESLDRFFRESRAKLREAIAAIHEARGLMAMVSRKFSEEYQIATVEVPEFATERFLIELDRLEALCARDFKGATSLLTRRRSTLGALFFDTVALKVVHIFEIADREVRTWMNGFIRPLDGRLNAFQEQANARIEGMGRIQDAETNLVPRVEELKKLTQDVAAQVREWEHHHDAVMANLGMTQESGAPATA